MSKQLTDRIAELEAHTTTVEAVIRDKNVTIDNLHKHIAELEALLAESEAELISLLDNEGLLEQNDGN